MQYGTKKTEQQARVDENFQTATELCRKEQNSRNTVNGNYLKGSNIKLKKKRKIHAAGKKDASGDEKLLIFFTWPSR